EYGIPTSSGYGVSNFLSNTTYSSQQIITAYPLPLDMMYRSSGTEEDSKKYLSELVDRRRKYKNNDINIELSKEFLEELQMNAYHGWIDKDVINHIAMVLKMIYSIYIHGVDSHQLRMKIFPLSLANEAKQWWINEGEGKITVWEELVEKNFCKFYPESYDREEEMLDE
ncbi:hypothetical protein Tco_1099139, partial [Tanacetum coccineum]